MRYRFAAVVFAVLTACAIPGPAAVPGVLEPLDAEALQDTLTELIATHPTAKRTNVALKVTDLETGEVLFDQNSDKLYTPASNLKIYTSAAALDLLGPEYRWTTKVLTHDSTIDGVMSESFYLRGGGDPMFSNEELSQVAAELLAHPDMKKIEGVFYIETREGWEELPLKGPGWMWDDDPDYYNMSVQSMMMDFNVITYEIAPGSSEGELVEIQPNPEIYHPKNLKRGNPYDIVGSRTRSDGKSNASIDRQPFNENFLSTGFMAVGVEPKAVKVTMHDPSDWIERTFVQILLDNEAGFDYEPSVSRYRDALNGSNSGGGGGGGSIFGPDDASERTLVEYRGKTNAEAVRHFLKVSENAVGEMLLLTLSEKFGIGEKVSWPSGAKVISDWLVNEAGLEEGSFRLVDGSGLSRYNLISADSSIRLLDYMKNESEHFEPFFDGLPIYKVALPKDAAAKWGGVPIAEFDAERVFAKPGGMSGVSTISGYVQTLDGRWLAFSLLGNGYIGSSVPVRDLRNQVWTTLVQYRSADVTVPAE
ncbi:MAG: D-alanyl-D-alanine carboxypeptidase [Planctomycetota bacterium]